MSAQSGEPPLSPAERRLRALMGICFLLFLPTGLFMAFDPGDVNALLNAIGRFACPTRPPAALGEGRLWVALSVSMMLMISYAAAAAWRDVRTNRRLIPMIVLSKAASSAYGLLWYSAAGGTFADLSAFLCDFPLFVATLALYLKAGGPPTGASVDPGAGG